MKYPKIETIFDRDKETFRVTPVIQESIKALWLIRPEALLWTEKLDGTNFQVKLHPPNTAFGELDPGKRSGPIDPNNKGDWMYVEVAESLKGQLLNFRDTLIAKTNENALPATLFGEIIGDKIQKVGRLYTGENIRRVHFFDLCLANGNFVDWNFLQELLKQASLLSVYATDFAGEWKPKLDYGFLDGFFYPGQPESRLESRFGTAPFEGFVIRPVVELRDGFGRRLIGKIKAKDFPRVK